MNKVKSTYWASPPVFFALIVAFAGWSVGCKSKPVAKPLSPTAIASAHLPQVGGQKALELRRLQSGLAAMPEFLSVTLLPGRGMNVFQITAYLPGRGETNLLTSPSLDRAAKLMDGGPADFNGNQSFSGGGAFLFPFANRIVGPVTTEKGTGEHFVNVTWHGRTIQVPANWRGKLPGAPWVAMHGEMLAAKAGHVTVLPSSDGATATAVYDLPANGHWFSDNRVTVSVQLNRDIVTATVTATNTGKNPEPVGIGWHPYFQLPSGVRANARLHIPASSRVEMKNYDDVIPTGELLSVTGTPYDFNAQQGAPLPSSLVDDSFVDLARDANGYVDSGIRDLGANYGMKVIAMSPHIRAIQVYSPADKAFIALEPQFNWDDPFGSQWHGVNTGMVTLQPGASVTWKVQLRLFEPSNEMIAQPPPPQLQ